MITPRGRTGYGLDAQWDDDVHHALHALLTGERQGYYCDFGSLEVLAKVLTRAFLHDGTYSTFRGHDARPAGRPRAARPGAASWCACRTTTRSATARSGDRLPELAVPSWSGSAPCCC